MNLLERGTTIYGVLIIYFLLTWAVYADYDVTVKEHCYKETNITQLVNGDYEVSDGEDVCVSTPNDWSQ